MHSLCQSYSLGEFRMAGQIFSWFNNLRFSWNVRKSDRSFNISENFRPCRVLSTWKGASRLPKVILRKYMTRRACLALRIIRFAGKSCFNWAVKKVWFFETKMKISQNLWIRFAWEQFPPLPEVTSYPEMHSMCLSMRCSKIFIGAKSFWRQQQFLYIFHDF